MKRQLIKPIKIPALKVNQWLEEWEDIDWNELERRGEPQKWFYQFSMSAEDLKRLSGIYPRTTTDRKRGAHDLGIQRRHDKKRSDEINRFVRFGYPCSELTEKKRNTGEFNDLRQPGWLPTAIVVNILTRKDKRQGQQVEPEDIIEVNEFDNGMAEIELPEKFSKKSWKHKTIPPIEVIDGQHRLWAFEENSLSGSYQLPVVAFVGLDLSWQAYLFYTINIKPKKINASLAFDLYPLLRTEEWLTKFEGHRIYREARAQELVDLLWSHPESPWYHRINMLGETGMTNMVKQAAWIRSLLASFTKSWEGTNVKIGGLFGTKIGQHDTVLPWTRTEQAAFLIVLGRSFFKAVKKTNASWATALRKAEEQKLIEEDDAAFFGRHSLINQDQGVRTILQVFNDLVFVQADYLVLHEWGGSQEDNGEDEEQVNYSINSLRKKKKIMNFLNQIAESLAEFDWRASSAPGLKEDERTIKASFRGSGGYKELRRYILLHISYENNKVGKSAKTILKHLGY